MRVVSPLTYRLAAVTTTLVVCLLSYAAAGGITPAQDVPYTEHVATRFVDATQKMRVESWGVLPTSGAYDVEVGTLGGADGAVFLTPDGLFWLDFAAGVQPDAVHGLKVSGAAAADCVAATSGGKLAAGASCSLVTDTSSGELQAIVSPVGVAFVKCASASFSCSTTGTVDAAFGSINSTAASPHGLWIGSASGLWVIPGGTSTAVQLLSESVWSVAYGALDDIVAAGNDEKLYFYDASGVTSHAALLATAARGEAGVAEVRVPTGDATAAALAPFRWEWVTIVPSGTGGVVDNMITGMAFDTAGRLYVANPTCLNVRARNGSFTRVSGLHGLPYNHLRAVAVGTGTTKHEQQVWMASDMGASLWNRFAGAPNEWRYFYGPRYHPGTVILDVATRGDFTVFATDGGVAVIEDQQWTLAQKAAHFETIQARHFRTVGPPGLTGGLTAGCNLQAFGNYSTCTNGPDANNGLWTSLVVTAESFRYAVTQDADALAKAIGYFNGMRFLNLVTGVKGLMARSTGAVGSNLGGGIWHNSTAFSGWEWMGDTSSDEVTGHMYAYPIVHALVANGTTQDQALQLVYNIAKYITDNGFTLVDVTGKPTTWGHWEPAYINGNRSRSDNRGVNSLQILSWLSEAYLLTKDAIFSAGYAQLCNSTNQYGANMLNLKIEAPCDDNYSDDELTFLPYYNIINHGTGAADPGLAPFNNLDDVWSSLNRTFGFVRPWRSDLWNAVTMAMTGNAPDDVMESMLWNLRSWPLEMVDWPVHNSNRTDIFFRPGPNRSFQTHTDSVRVLPANERNQYLWNSDPHDLDGGNGMRESDAGAWLLPYWMARYHGLISAPAA